MSSAFGIDMGTCNLKIYSRQEKAVHHLKDTIAIVSRNQLYAYGDEAYSMFEKAPEAIDVCFPIVGGVIAEFDNMQTMLYEVLETEMRASIRRSDIVVAVPHDITEVEKKAFSDMFSRARVRPHSVRLCEKPLADALGIGLDVSEPTGVLVVDVGADTTEMSVMSLGGIVLSELIPWGGNRLDESIVTFMRRQFNLVIGRKTAMELKERIGSASEGRGETATIVGRDVVSGLPITFNVDSDMVYEGMREDLDNLAYSLRLMLERVPPELAKDIVSSGIYLTGGGASIHNLATFLEETSNIRINVCEDGEETVAKGLGRVIIDSKFAGFGYEMKSKIFN